ncbi:MAG TPA: DUF4236 domain-containing protein [Candidatus Acidoferrales bacterium]|nr:DUF4236 domain-containing protein [Candidatus Acidoferrales bacterium]
MPWYIRKSFTRGPFRLNLSKSGLGASVGVKRLRVGIGPKGTYLQGGRDGLYFRQSLNAKTPRRQLGTPQHLGTPSLQSDGEVVEYETIQATDDEVAAAINERLSAFRWSRVVGIAAFTVPLYVAMQRLYLFAGVLFIGLIVASAIVANREAKERRIELNYNDLPETFTKFFNLFVESFQEAAKCSAIWRITTQSASRDSKYTAGAENLVERSLTRITFNDLPIIASVPVTCLSVAGGKLALLPDRMLFFGPRGVTALRYKDVSVSASSTNFRESGPVPSDSTNVGTTWQYVNKSGGPDRRFANNRQISIQRYSDLEFNHPNLSFRLEFSRTGIAEVLAKCIKGLALAETGLTWNVGNNSNT